MKHQGYWVTDRDITTKTKFIEAIRYFVTHGVPIFPDPDDYDPTAKVHLSRGELLLWDAIATYLERRTTIPEKQIGISWFTDIHKYLVDAFTEFRTHDDWRVLRETYRAQTDGLKIPDLTAALDPTSAWNTVVGDLTRRIPLIAGREGRGVGEQLHAYFNAERAYVTQTWQRFLRQCYLPSEVAKQRAPLRAQFGRTQIEIDGASGGRHFIELSRRIPQQDVAVLDRVVELIDAQQSLGPAWNPQVTIDALAAVLQLRTGTRANDADRAHRVLFVSAEDNDPAGYRFSVSTCATSAGNVVAMIEEVIARWDPRLFGSRGLHL